MKIYFVRFQNGVIPGVDAEGRPKAYKNYQTTFITATSPARVRQAVRKAYLHARNISAKIVGEA